MINIVFSKMEAYSGNFGISLAKLQQRSNPRNTSSGALTPSLLDDADLMSQKNLSDKSLQLKQGSIAASHPQLMTEQATPNNEEEVKGATGEISLPHMTEPSNSPLQTT